MTDRWIVGVDGSEASVDALGFALHHALSRDVAISAVTAFHVPAVMALFTAKRGFGVDELGLSATAGHELDVIIEKLGVGDRVTPMVVEGQAAHVLVDAAADAELLIVGQQGDGELRQHRLGSVSRYCATHATAPVVVVPAGWTSARPAAASGWASTGATTPPRPCAGRWGSPRTVSPCAWSSPWMSPRARSGDHPRALRRRDRRAGAGDDRGDRRGRRRWRHRAGVRARYPAAALREAGRSADLVVVGARGHGLIAAELLGSVSTSVVQDTVVPVVVVPDRAGQDQAG